MFYLSVNISLNAAVVGNVAAQRCCAAITQRAPASLGPSIKNNIIRTPKRPTELVSACAILIHSTRKEFI